MIQTRQLPWSAGLARLLLLAAAVFFLNLAACRVTDVPFWRPAPPLADSFEVEQVRDIAYHTGSDADPHRHSLDLFYPKGHPNYPVALLIHGGSWTHGDNRCYGLYPAVAEFLASCGIGVVLPNYRLTPQVRHPEHIRDVARAFAWAHAHIAEYGGRPDQCFLVGHSSGGHLVSLLATDERYLQAEGLATTDIRGVIALSGVYRIPEGKQEFTLEGDTERAFRLDQLMPVRTPSASEPGSGIVPAIPVRLNVFGPAFGNDPRARADASPLYHVRPGLPPFLLFSAERDLPMLPGMAEEFQQALVNQGNEAWLFRIKQRNHNSILFMAISAEDPVGRTMVDFIRRHTQI